MDPFNEVQEDALQQINKLNKFINDTGIVTEDSKLDFINNYQELEETIEDLNQAISISEANPNQFNLTQQDISKRHEILKDLQAKMREVNSLWDNKANDPKRQREVTTMSNRISQDTSNDPFSDRNKINNEFDQFQQQEVIREQDTHLDSIHQTMYNLNQQAMIMGGELEDQGFMLDDLDQDLDRTSSKLERGLKRVNFVIEKNRERASDWCIGILVVALCVLLILVIAV